VRQKQVDDFIAKTWGSQYVTEGLPVISLDTGFLEQFTYCCRLRTFIRFQFSGG